MPLTFTRDMTRRLSCRTGDYLIFAKCRGPFAPPDKQYAMADLWQLSDGDHILLTSRYQDLPDWFEIHPLETANDAARWVIKRLKAGYTPPDAPMEGSNIRRASAGDRLIWVGQPRIDMDAGNDVLALISLNVNVLVVGEPLRTEGSELPEFGALLESPPAKVLELVRKGWQAMIDLGGPRTVNAIDWKLGG